jgi:hypothetical protein
LGQTGLDSSKVGSFISLFTNFLKNQAGADLLNRILGKVPELQSLVG